MNIHKIACYERILTDLTTIVNETEETLIGQSAGLELDSLRGIVLSVHANLIRNGVHYTEIDKGIFCLWTENGVHTVKKEELSTVLSRTEISEFLSGIRKDHRSVAGVEIEAEERSEEAEQAPDETVNAPSEKQPSEESVPSTPKAEKKDVKEIRKESLLIHFAAVGVTSEGEEGGSRYGVTVAPIDPENMYGKFAYTILDADTGERNHGISEPTDKGVEQVRFPVKDYSLNIFNQKKNNSDGYAPKILVPAKYEKTVTSKGATLGTDGHIMLHDDDLTIHVFPTSLSNTENGNAGILAVFEKGEELSTMLSEQGLIRFSSGGEEYELLARWDNDNDRLISKIRRHEA